MSRTMFGIDDLTWFVNEVGKAIEHMMAFGIPPTGTPDPIHHLYFMKGFGFALVGKMQDEISVYAYAYRTAEDGFRNDHKDIPEPTLSEMAKAHAEKDAQVMETKARATKSAEFQETYPWLWRLAIDQGAMFPLDQATAVHQECALYLSKVEQSLLTKRMRNVLAGLKADQTKKAQAQREAQARAQAQRTPPPKPQATPPAKPTTPPKKSS